MPIIIFLLLRHRRLVLEIPDGIHTVRAAAAQDSHFNNYIAQPVEPILWLAVYVGVTALIVFFGVQKGVEKASKVMMPALAVLSLEWPLTR